MDMRDRLEIALKDELKLVSLYCDIANKVTDPMLRAMFMGIMGEKFGHIRTLTTLLINGG